MRWFGRKRDSLEPRRSDFHPNLMLMYLIEEDWGKELTEELILKERGISILGRRLVEDNAPSPEEAWSSVIDFLGGSTGPTSDWSATIGGKGKRAYTVKVCGEAIRFVRKE